MISIAVFQYWTWFYYQKWHFAIFGGTHFFKNWPKWKFPNNWQTKGLVSTKCNAHVCYIALEYIFLFPDVSCHVVNMLSFVVSFYRTGPVTCFPSPQAYYIPRVKQLNASVHLCLPLFPVYTIPFYAI